MKNAKITAVICKDSDDFLAWGRGNGFVCSSPYSRKIYVGDETYLCIYKPEHLCSITINEIIDTSAAPQNPFYHEIHQRAMSNLIDIKLDDGVTKPPLGIMPRQLHNEKRFTNLVETIKRYIEAYQYIDPEWITEYNELLEKIK